MQYDLIVLGDTPEAHSAALAAGRLRRRVALVDPSPGFVSGRSANSETFRRFRSAIHSCTQLGASPRPGGSSAPPLPALAMEESEVAACERAVVRQRLERFSIEQFSGAVQFINPDVVEVESGTGADQLQADHFIIATGTQSHAPSWVPPGDGRLLLADDLIRLRQIPRTLLIVGASDTGLEAAGLFSMLGCRVTLVERARSLRSDSAAGASALVRQLQRLGVRFLPDAEVIAADSVAGQGARVELLSGELLTAEQVLFTIERCGRTQGMRLDEIGVQLDERGRIWCDESLQTWLPHVLAVGPVVGHPRGISETADAPQRIVWRLLGGGATAPLIRRTSAGLAATV